MNWSSSANTLRIAILALSLTAWTTTAGEAQHAHHEHGRGQLNIALESSTEFIAELTVPADAAYGFEHAPRNEAEKKQVEEARDRLLKGFSSLFNLAADSACEPKGRFVETAHSGEKHKSDSHDHHGHHDEPEQEHHADVRIEWTVNCQRSVEATALEVDWSELLPAIEELEVVVISATRQDSYRLRNGAGKLSL